MTDLLTPSAEWRQMELARYFPRRLDSHQPDGGVLGVLTDPGGKVAKTLAELTTDTSLRQEMLLDSARVPLLIRHVAEAAEDYAFRCAIAAPRGSYWHAVESLAGRPYGRGIRIEGEDNLPEVLRAGGDWHEDVDLRGTDLRSWAAIHARDSGGYGLGYVLVDYDAEASRPYLRWADGSTIHRVDPGPSGRPARIYTSATEEIGGKDIRVAIVFERGIDERKPATVYTFRPNSKGNLPEEFDASLASERRELPQFREIPVVPWPTGRMNERHLVIPPLLDAAKLDHLKLQVESNSEYGVLIANTFMRFAKGIPGKEQEQFEVLGNAYLYITSGERADLKWVTLAADAAKAGMDLSDALGRAIEVAGLAPMMTRPTGDERATGQLIAAARAQSVAEIYALQDAATLSRVWGLMARFTDRPEARPQLELHHDFGLGAADMEHLRILTQLYLDPGEKMSRLQFWSELQRKGVISEDADLEALATATETNDQRLKRQELDLKRAELVLSAAGSGMLLTSAEGRAAIYAALKSVGALPATLDAAALAKADIDAGLLVPSSLEAIGGVFDREL